MVISSHIDVPVDAHGNYYSIVLANRLQCMAPLDKVSANPICGAGRAKFTSDRETNRGAIVHPI